MKSIIKEIYDGTRGYYATIDVGDEYRRLAQERLDWVYRLKSELNEEQQELVDKILYRQFDLEADAMRTAYTEGVKVGIRLAVEAFK